jgi:hypothetical protein
MSKRNLCFETEGVHVVYLKIIDKGFIVSYAHEIAISIKDEGKQ